MLFWFSIHQGGNYHAVPSVEYLRELMATFYNLPMFNTNQRSNPVNMIPYHDGFGFGEIFCFFDFWSLVEFDKLIKSVAPTEATCSFLHDYLWPITSSRLCKVIPIIVFSVWLICKIQNGNKTLLHLFFLGIALCSVV